MFTRDLIHQLKKGTLCDALYNRVLLHARRGEQYWAAHEEDRARVLAEVYGVHIDTDPQARYVPEVVSSVFPGGVNGLEVPGGAAPT